MSERFAGRFLLLQRLGAGGMGEVYLARDLADGTECAVKRLGAGPSPEVALALRREFEALARLRHPSVVAVRDLGFAPDGAPYLVMEYVPGLPADRALARGDLPSLMWTAARVAHGLEALHACGVVHGDVKPMNVLVAPGAGPGDLPRDVRLVDLGLASGLGLDGRPPGGTPGYAAPEVVRGATPDPRSDLYGFGATLYALLTGEPFANGASSGRPSGGSPRGGPLEDAGAPPALTHLVLRLLAASPGERPGDAAEVRRELERLHPAARRPLADRLATEVVVGRAAEGARFESALAAAARQTRRVLVEGAAGVGKSALLAQLAARAARAPSEGRSGGRVWRIHPGPEAPGAVALAFLRWLAAEQGDPGAIAALPAAARAALEPEGALPGEPARVALAGAAAMWLAALARTSGPVVIVVDDAHELDAASVALLRRVALHASSPPSLWLWAGRGGDDAHRPLAEAGVAELWRLGPLDEASVGRLVDARLGTPAPPPLVARLWELAGGHPGLTVDRLAAAAVAGAIRDTDAGFVVDDAALARLPSHESFEQAQLERLEALPDPARETAVLLAACGSADEESLRAVWPGLPVDALPALEAAGFARRTGGAWSLATPAFAERVLAAADAGRRERSLRRALARPGASGLERFRVHRSLGDVGAALAAAEEAFAAVADFGLAVQAASLAEGSSTPGAASAWHTRAAVIARAAGRYAAAAHHYARALESSPGDEPRGWRWEGLATSRLRAGDVAGAAAAIRLAFEEPIPPAARALLLAGEAGVRIAEGRHEASLGPADAARAEAIASGDPRAIAICELTRVSGLLPLQRLLEAEEALRRAIEAAALSNDETLALHCAIAEHDVRHRQGRSAEVEAALDDALARARRGGHRFLLEQLLAAKSVHALERGQWRAALDAQEEMLRVALEDDRRASAAFAMACRAHAEGMLGRTEAARRHARAAVRLARRYHPAGEALALRMLARSLRISGRRRGAARAIRVALERALRDGAAHEVAWCRIEYAGLLQSGERWDAAAAVLAAGVESCPASSVEGIVLRSLAGRGALRRADPEGARRHAEAAEAGLRALPHAAYAAAHVAQLAAERSIAGGDAERAESRVRAALAAFEAHPSPVDAAHAALGFAGLGLAQSGRLPLRDWLEYALPTFERVGDRTSGWRALALLHELLRRGDGAENGDGARGLIEAVSGLLRSLSDVGELARRAMEMAGRRFGAERGVLLLADAETGELTPMAEYGAVDAQARANALGYSRRVVRTVTESGSGIVIDDALEDPARSSNSMVTMGLRSVICVPLFIGGRAVGVVYLDDSRRARKFTEADRGLLEGFAHLLAVAIEKGRGQEEVQRANEQLVGENQSLRHEAQVRVTAEGLVARNPAMRRVLSDVELAARSNVTVLITGESGTGKERVARLLHHLSRRRTGRFVTFNCGAVPESLLESELFGILSHVATGVRPRRGVFQQADGGTLLLDEIGEMPMQAQVALLNVLQSHEITPLGGSRPIPVDVRIVAATHRDLRQLMREKRFREDLYYRLAVLHIQVPPLRDRKSDIPEFAQRFLEEFAGEQKREVPPLSPDFIATLMQSDWPGNVRELQNYLERVLAMTPKGELRPDPLPPDLQEHRGQPRISPGRKLADALAEYERQLVDRALESTDWNQSRAARTLGISETALRYKLRRLAMPSARQNQRTRQKPR